jgi:hypothetical protein
LKYDLNGGREAQLACRLWAFPALTVLRFPAYAPQTQRHQIRASGIIGTQRPGSGYGDPEARLNDDRKIQALLAETQFRIGNRLNVLTFFLVVVGILNVIVLALQLWQSMSHKG